MSKIVQWGLYDPEKGWRAKRPITREEDKRDKAILRFYDAGEVMAEIADLLGISRSTVHRVLRRHNKPLRQPKKNRK